MKTHQTTLLSHNWKDEISKISFAVDIFILFVSPDFSEKQEAITYLKEKFPYSTIVGCSTAGEISDVQVYDASISLSAIKFDEVDFKKVLVDIDDMNSSFNAGRELAKKLNQKDLKHILVFSDGLNVNGADLVAGMNSELPEVSITGGLAADGSDFNKTFVVYGSTIADKKIVGLGLYGEKLNVGFSSYSGWDSFGIERLVTKSNKNVLYELDGLPALSLYKSFLGEQANELPGSGLLFPLSVRVNEFSKPVVRTILGIDEETQSLTFAGNIPQGSYVRLMKANVDRLINGAEKSAELATESMSNDSELAILISCVGRRLVLKQLVEEEVEVVREIVGDKPKITGFYSYGEIAPFGKFSSCELHNQTMTITTISEC